MKLKETFLEINHEDDTRIMIFFGMAKQIKSISSEFENEHVRDV